MITYCQRNGCPSATAHNQRGFTLVELSIVLVIIGLIVGGVLVGRDMIQAAQLRDVVKQIEYYNTAVMTFKIKYSCLPGDCPKATQFFGMKTAAGACTTGEDDAATADGTTCNGNGDGYINLNGDDEVGTYDNDEPSWFWQQLGDAKLIDGNYCGAVDEYDQDPPTPGCIDYPHIKNFEPAEWVVSAQACGIPDGQLNCNGAPNNMYSIDVGGQSAPNPIFTPAQAFYLDSKMDDGFPGTGNVETGDIGVWPGFDPTTYVPGPGNCESSYYYNTATYVVADPTVSCWLLIKAPF